MKKIFLIIVALMAISISGMAKRNKIFTCHYRIVAPDTLESVYKDSIFGIKFELHETYMGIAVANYTQQPIFVEWEQSSMILGGISKRCIHSGIKYTNRSEQQPRTVIAPECTITDMMVPADHIWWSDGTGPLGWKTAAAHWVNKPIVYLSTKVDEGSVYTDITPEEVLSQEGKVIGIMLAMEINGKMEYKSFKIMCYNFQQKEQ